MIPNPSIQQHKQAFVLADGLAPFHVFGTVSLSIIFAGQPTSIEAYVAENLCTDVILGMDYIRRYNLQINTRQQLVSIEFRDRMLYMKSQPRYSPQPIPIHLAKALRLPPRSDRSITVFTSVSSIDSPFIPHENFMRNTSLHIPQTFLHVQDYVSIITLSNPTSYTQDIVKDVCVGYLYPSGATTMNPYKSSITTNQVGAAYHCDVVPVFPDSIVNTLMEEPSLPVHQTPLLINNQRSSNSLPYPIIPDTISSIPSPVDQEIFDLLKKVPDHQHHRTLQPLLFHYRQLFDTTHHNIAKTPIHHVIKTIPHSPPASRSYPQPDKEEPMFKIVQEFLQAGLITESHSPYAAPALLVKKKDDSFRLVVDYKKLNLITIKDSSPLPHMEETIRKLGQGYKYFSKLDLKSGFYQIPITNIDKEKTAFITPFGLFQFNVLPMGLKNSPPTFQKVMSDTLQSCRQFSFVYLDDIIVFSKSPDEHFNHLKQVFSALLSKQFVLNPPKCEIMVSTIDYLGHTIDATTISPLDEKIQAIINIKEPDTLARANKFLGALSWYRKFIPKFATLAAPINTVTNLTKQDRRKFKWSSEQSEAFHKLKQLLTTTPLFLHFPLNEHPLILTTDASNFAIGGVLQQEVNGELKNLYYHSQVLTPCEQRYSVIEKEALAIYKCFQRMRSYLLGKTIIVKTDHCPLCNIMNKNIRNSRVERITHLLQEYNIDQIVHVNGRDNCLPDYLSRYPKEQDDELFDIEYGLGSKETLPLLPPQSDNILNAMILRPRKKAPESEKATTPVDAFVSTDSEANSDIIQDNSTKSFIPNTFSSNYFDTDKLQQEQERDPQIQEIITQLKQPNQLPFVFKHNLLWKLITPSSYSSTKHEVIYLPSSMIKQLLYACHDDPMTGGHFSLDRTYFKIKTHYWWPKMKLSISQHIQACLLCQQHNTSRHKRHGQLHSISPPDGPFMLIGIDFCGPLTRSPRDNQYVLVITDYFTRFITAVALPDCTAETTAYTLFNDYFCKFGVPGTILSDQGRHFQNHLMQNIEKLIGCNHIFSTPYHPQTNGVVERFNSTFITQVAKLHDVEHNNWDDYLQAVVFAYNSGIHRTTNYSPYQLLFGRSPRLPIYSPRQSFSFPSPNSYFQQLQKTLRIYHEAATDNVIHQQQITKQRYDTNRQDPQYNLGDLVLTRIHGIRNKLHPKFSPTPKIIISIHHPTYFVQDTETNITSQVHVGDMRRIYVD